MKIKKTQDQPPCFSEENIVASICRESFFEFVKEFWDTVIAEEYTHNWHVEYLCNELQRVAERVFKNLPKEYDLVVNISPGTTKSTIASVMFPAWCWTRKTHMRFICGSYTHALALDLSRRSRDVVRSDKYRRVFPHIELRKDQDTKGFFQNNHKGTRFSVGTGGSVTGMHGHFLIIDDPLDPNGALSEADLKAANNWMRETLPSRKVDKSIAATILIMQRLHQNDPSSVMVKDENVKHICLPAVLTEHIRPPKMRHKYKDGYMDPVRLGEKALEEQRKKLGEFAYAGQYLQHPVPRGGGMFKPERLQIDVPHKIIRKVRYWDKAGTQDGGAYTVGAQLGVDTAGRYWILDIVRGQWSSDRREEVILSTASIDGRAVEIGIEQEPGSGGKESAESTVRRLAGYVVRTDRPTGDKIYRADPFSVQVNGGNVRMAAGNWNTPFIDEMTYFPNSTYKDQIDACSGAFAMLTKPRYNVGAL